MTDHIDYEKLGKVIAQQLHAMPPREQVLWDGQQAANYLGISKKHFIDHISKTPGFPIPIRMPGRAGRLSWYMCDVVEWTKSQKLH